MKSAALTLCFVCLLGIFSRVPVSALAGGCDLRLTSCNTVANKVPSVSQILPTGSIESNLDFTQKKRFEHLVGHALADTNVVAWATREFAKRIHRFLIEGNKYKEFQDRLDADNILLKAFAPKCTRHNPGFVGPHPEKIRAALEEGNIRETWSLMYCMTKSKYFDSLLKDLLGRDSLLPKKLETELGMNATAIQNRWELIKETQELQPRFQYAAGVPDFQFPSFDSWVRFNFENDNPRSGELVWHGAREWVGSVETDLWSDDPSLEPPLSAAEIAYQCGNQPRCKLAWSVGETSYYVPRVPFGPSLPGFKARAEALGYRWVAGASGTTANMLEIGRILGFTDTELVALRATMLAWMLAKDDHSFFEIMLGAEPFMAHGFHMAMGLQDFAQLFPKDVETATGTAFSFCEVWVQIKKKLLSSEGLDLLQSMDERSRRYTIAVLSSCTAHELPTRATLSASTAKASEALVSMLAMVGLMGWFLRWRQRQSDSKELKLDPKQSNLLS